MIHTICDEVNDASFYAFHEYHSDSIYSHWIEFPCFVANLSCNLLTFYDYCCSFDQGDIGDVIFAPVHGRNMTSYHLCYWI